MHRTHYCYFLNVIRQLSWLIRSFLVWCRNLVCYLQVVFSVTNEKTNEDFGRKLDENKIIYVFKE